MNSKLLTINVEQDKMRMQLYGFARQNMVKYSMQDLKEHWKKGENFTDKEIQI